MLVSIYNALNPSDSLVLTGSLQWPDLVQQISAERDRFKVKAISELIDGQGSD